MSASATRRVAATAAAFFALRFVESPVSNDATHLARFRRVGEHALSRKERKMKFSTSGIISREFTIPKYSNNQDNLIIFLR